MKTEITFSKIKSSTIEGGKRILKVFQFGAKTAKESYPFGFDSVPPADWTAVYAETANKGESLIIGYVNKQQLAELGGSRMYSLGESGEVAGFLYCRASGVLELNGADYSAVRYQNLKQSIDDTNALVNAELIKVQAVISGLGGVYVRLDIASNLTAAESPTVKLK